METDSSLNILFTKLKLNEDKNLFKDKVDGKIIDSTGTKISENKVNFNISRTKNEHIYVIFETNKIDSKKIDENKSLKIIFLILFPLLIILFLTIRLIIISKRSKKQNQTTNTEEVNQNLINHIYNAKSLGWRDEQIKQTFLNA